MAMADIDTRIIAAAESSDGLVSAQTLDKLGLSRQGRRTRVADGRLNPLEPGVFLLGGLELTWSRRLGAAHLSTGGAISHVAAAATQGFDRIDAGEVDVSVDSSRRPRLRAGRVHRVTDLSVGDLDLSGPFPLTRPERTLIDIAPRLGRRLLRLVLDDACRQGLVDKDRLEGRLDVRRRSGVSGLGPLAAMLAEPGFEPVLDSWLERKAKTIIDASGLPPGRWQMWSAPDGRATRVDLAYESARLVVEFDGHGSHATRSERQADAERQARLTADGWCVLRFTYDDVVQRPDYVVATIAHHLARSLVP